MTVEPWQVRPVLVAVAVAAAVRRPGLAPVAAAVAAVAVVDAALVLGDPPPRVAMAAHVAWPGISAVLSWEVWRPRGAGAVGGLFLAAGLAAGAAPWSWRVHPLAYQFVLALPHVASALLSTVAWATGAAWRPLTSAGRCAAILAWSGFVDLTFGFVAQAPASYHAFAWPLSWLTMGALLAELLRARRSVRS